ncbi:MULTISPECIES: SUMF1/EgtB/PvdO family nonheme iron enzyme [Bradyrhizobium]|uniref:Formylglycine-generating enzyme required for sulfatase activity/class 3 adenylate cyclase n=1 Tax=Bradyrhizobium yuanmingense TaxID=108015 RepID=A0ABV4GAZ3_9BRAD|nr:MULTISPECIES: SUMF1/EgtB/PvdO family nonheme iron enzyme [Bradyrhizobium]MCA1470511.1 SUMF1/EgtB/PvdO family nonheme iron enzyme [Bradyrhizobium sp. IC3195]MCA1526995.1 SUMF1/EgtB/PvdO family nonheme iron enzyme [Bradyrhizobium yuanmingense]
MGEIRNFRPGNHDEPPPHSGMPRRLAAIIVGDIASYSRMMQADEEGTHARVKRIERDIIQPSIIEHHGSLVKTTGDGFIAVFDSPVEAVRCSIVIQQNLVGRNASIPKHSRLEYRIGVNLGDVIVEPDDIYGDGVNIATRIEGIAQPGQVYISGAIYEQIKHKIVCGYESLGDRKVKNITDPVRVYRVLPDADAVGKTRSRRENVLLFLLITALLVIAGYVLWYVLVQHRSQVGQQAAAPPIAAPLASPTPQSVPSLPSPAAPAPQAAPAASPLPTTVPPPAASPSPSPASSPSVTPVREPEMIAIRGGSFAMGSNDDPTERPVHQVTIKPFSIGKYPVTVQEWNECAAAKACGFTATGKDDAPVSNVSWTDAQQYVAWLAQATKKPYRLPSEAEWEYAARGGTQTKYWWGDKLQPGMAGCKDCGELAAEQPAKVGSFKPNPFGLYDMGGGIDQWVADCWHRTYQGAPSDGSAWTSPDCGSHVLRSGSWKNDARYVRPSNRGGYDTGVRYPTHGFRIALSP